MWVYPTLNMSHLKTQGAVDKCLSVDALHVKIFLLTSWSALRDLFHLSSSSGG